MNEKVFIIAEAGVNHNGSLDLAKKLIDVAADCQADAVKFQTFKTENLVSRNAEKAEYQKKTTGETQSQFDMIKDLELGFSDHKELIEYCLKKEIMFLSTPFDHDSIDLLYGLGMQIFKIPSGEITNLPYLRKIGSLQKEVILSTGMANLDEIKEALEILTSAGTPLRNICVLHATTEYPCPMDEVNLKAMQTIAKTFNVKAGYSDHTQGIEVAIAAAATGAKVIEKHFTLSRQMEGPDHKASLEPNELSAMINAVRNIELAMGDGVKKPSKSEIKNMLVSRKSIVAKTDIRKGETFSESNLAVKRPGSGISPMKWDVMIGRQASRDYQKDDLI